MTLIRSRFLTLGTLVLVLSAGLSASAAERGGPPRAKDSGDTPAVAAQAQTPNARLAALIAAGGKIVRSTGVDSVTRIKTGVYCIKPKSSAGIDPQKSLAVVSVEYYWSQFNEVTVQWASQGSGCGSDKFGVYTLGDFNLDAKYTFSNDVGFSIYVP
jgi:hypothetical protein